MKTLLLQMMEWHAKTIHGKDYYDVWHAGRFLDEWVDQETLKEIKNTFGHYEKADSFRALNLFDQKRFAGRKLRAANSPNVVGDEIYKLSDFFYDSLHNDAPQICLDENLYASG